MSAQEMFPNEQAEGLKGPADDMTAGEVAEHIASNAAKDFDPNKPPSEAAEDQGHRLANVQGIEEVAGTDEQRQEAKSRHPSAMADDVDLAPVRAHVPLAHRISDNKRRTGILGVKQAKAALNEATERRQAKQQAADEARKAAETEALTKKRDISHLPQPPRRSSE